LLPPQVLGLVDQRSLLRFRFWRWCFLYLFFRSGPLPLFTEALLAQRAPFWKASQTFSSSARGRFVAMAFCAVAATASALVLCIVLF
jgi:hypothetical protein